MKKAFTMIELIFVIVILGILAAVALPKFMGVASQAREGNLKSFTGTLNGTLGPSWWSKAMPYDGNISKLGINSINQLKTYTDVPKSLISFNLDDCNVSDKYTLIGKFDKAKLGTDVDYFLACKDGTASEAPKFMLVKAKVSTNEPAVGDRNSSDINDTNKEIDFNTKPTVIIQQ